MASRNGCSPTAGRTTATPTPSATKSCALSRRSWPSGVGGIPEVSSTCRLKSCRACLRRLSTHSPTEEPASVLTYAIADVRAALDWITTLAEHGGVTDQRLADLLNPPGV